jgi:amino acid adenylation domain-containing protein
VGTPDPDDDPSGPQWIFCLTVHHGVIDGSSIELLMHELRTDYAALAGGNDLPPRATAPLDYGDYVLWQRASSMRDRETADLAFWTDNLEGAVTALDFPFDNLRPAAQSHRGGRCFRRVGSVVAAGLRERGTELSATLFMVVLAGWTALLARYCQQDEIVIGTPISGRQPAELESVVGLLVNTLPLRISLGDDPTFGDLIRRTRSVLLAGMDHQSVPFERIVDAVGAGHDLSRHPVFQVMATMQPDQPGREQFGNAKMSSLPIDWGWSRFTDLSLVVMEHDGAIDLGLEYSADLLDAATAERLLGHLEGILEAGVAEPDAPTSQLVFNREEHHKLLVEWNATSQPYPSGKCIHQLIAERTAEAPHAVAAEFGGLQLTYAELDVRANRLAHKLRELGVDRDVIVAICIDRSLDMVVAVLAVLKAGGAYLPLDVAYPEDRLDFIIKDAGATVLLTNHDMAPRLKSHRGEVLFLDDDTDLEEYPLFPPEADVGPGDLAYLIYTSGSTGYPKGVLIEHESVVNLAAVTATELEFDATTRFLQFATLAFDASTLEILVALSVGATICLTTRETVASTQDLMDLLVRERISATLLPPSLLAILPEADLPHMRTLMCGGEACTPELARKWKRRVGGKLFNVYGPTETTVLTTSQLIADVDEETSETIPIGRPLGNVQAFVLDANLIPVPIGCPAELYIGGRGLARGYLGRPELTAERFVPHPFSSEPGARLYRTGDCVRWLPDGTLEYRGRLDNQVKFRGYRIELGEIEQTLMRHERILDALVMVREEGEKRLVAYLVTDNDAELTYSEVRTFLRRTLPDYMVPSAIVVLDAMPLTSNLFKVDRAKLPIPQAQSSSASTFVAPRGPIEELVARVWCEVLGLAAIGALDDVFELGANSLDAARVASKLRSHTFDVSLRSLFDFPTVDAVARLIVQGLAAESGESIEDLLDLAEEEAP